MKTVQLVKLRSGQGKQATVTFEIIGDDFLEHILLSASPPGTIFEMSYQIVEAGTQKGNLHDTGNASNRDQDENLHTLTTATHTSTSNEKDSPTPDRPKGGELAKWAGILCNDEEFQKWIGIRDAKAAREKILTQCGVHSRADLDHDRDAALIFREIMHDFDKFKHGSFDNRFDPKVQNPDKNQIHVDDMPKYLVWPPKD